MTTELERGRDRVQHGEHDAVASFARPAGVPGGASAGFVSTATAYLEGDPCPWRVDSFEFNDGTGCIRIGVVTGDRAAFDEMRERMTGIARISDAQSKRNMETT